MFDYPSHKLGEMIEDGPGRSKTEGEDKVNIVFAFPIVAQVVSLVGADG